MTADTMSVDIGSMPPWKRELLERKRRQEEEERRRQKDEYQRLSHMPVWKRELMMKKKRNVVFVSKSPSLSDVSLNDKDQCTETMTPPAKADLPTVNGSMPVVDNHVTVTVVSGQTSPRLAGGAQIAITEWDTSVTDGDMVDNGETEEHLLPIHYNPWLKSDIQKKRVGRHSYRKSNESDMANDSNLVQPDDNNQVLSTSPSHDSYLDTNVRLSGQDQTRGTNDDSDSVFGEEEVTYGRGFVHKLLRRFKHMSAKDEYHSGLNKRFSPRRTYSSEDILEDSCPRKSMARNHLSTGDIYEGYNSLSYQKAQSVDNLISRTKSESFDSSSNNLSASSEDNLVDEPPQSMNPNVVNIEIVDDLSPGALVVDESGSQDNNVEDLPRSNIVSTARSVFESISVRATSPDQQHHTSDSHSFRTSIASSTSSNLSVSSPQSNPLSSISSAENERSLSPIPVDRDCSLSPIHVDRDCSFSPIPRQRHRTNSATELTESLVKTDSSRSWEPAHNRPGSRSYIAAKKPETSPKPSATVDIVNREIITSEDFNANHASTVDDVDDSDSGVTLLSHKPRDTSVYMSHSMTNKPSSTIFSSVGTGVSAISNVPKPQEKLDQPTVRDQSARYNPPVANHAPIAHYNRSNSIEQPAVSDEITLDNQSAKDTLDVDDSTADHFNDVHNKYSPEKISVTKTPTAGKETNPVNADHRNPEANRLNLNLNLNELNRKKSLTESSTDINRNNKTGLTSSSSTVTTNGSVDSFPLPPMRIKKKKKKQAPEGPGSLLIRPASNLLAAGTKTEYLQLNQYHDIKRGEFAPARKRPSHYYEDFEDDVPVTNIDDYLPVTNIDDVSPAGTPREGDPSKHHRAVRRYEFMGAGVIVDRSLLTKTRHKKMKINFNESATSMFEYPSEQSLLDLMPPERGDFDFCDPNGPKNAVKNGSLSDDEAPDYVESSGLLSNPGVGSAATLGAYQSKSQVKYYFGMDQDEEQPVKRPQPEPAADTGIKPADEEDFTWSDATTSDMLF